MKHTKQYGNRQKQFRGERVHAVFGRGGLIGAYADKADAQSQLRFQYERGRRASLVTLSQ